LLKCYKCINTWRGQVCDEKYKQILQYYTLMRMKNKMKDFEAKFEEWWEVIEAYFTKELEKNMA
jgi:hypothetical protein